MTLTTLADGARHEQALQNGTYMIGRGESCRIRFAAPDVSERHAILTVRGDEVLLEDLNSANGTFVNGEPIEGAVRLTGSMVVQIAGSSMLRVSEDEPSFERVIGAADAPSPAAPVAEPPADRRKEQEPPSAPATDPLREVRRNVQEQIQRELLKRMDMKRLTLQGVEREELEDTAREKIRQIIDEVVANGRLPEGIDPVRLEDDVFNEALRLGPLEDLLADDGVSEIMVNGPSKVYVERGGRLVLSDCQFTDDASVLAVIERIIAPLGRRCDESQPYVDARLPDGSRVNAIISPLALSGPTVTIRKFSKKALTVDDFVRFGTWTRNAAEFMKLCVLLRKNIIVAGGTGSGKTTLLNLLSGFIPETERIVEPVGRHVDDASPMVDARLPDGSRVNAIVPPLALDGASLTIRKFAEKKLTTEDLIRFGSMTREMALFLEEAVKSRQNILVSGGTGSGKTTLLNILSQFIPERERLVTIEDSAELKLSHRNIVRLEARPANIEGRGRVAIRDLVVNALRMRPDRIIVGECRGAEALDMLQAMNTGHDGSLTTAHANNPRDAMSRLENMVMMAGYELPSSAIREQIASAINLVVQQTRLADGSRKVVKIVEVTGREGDVIQMQDIFEFRQTGFDDQGRIQGYYTATGNIPYFIDELRQRGVLTLDMAIFVPKA